MRELSERMGEMRVYEVDTVYFGIRMRRPKSVIKNAGIIWHIYLVVYNCFLILKRGYGISVLEDVTVKDNMYVYLL